MTQHSSPPGLAGPPPLQVSATVRPAGTGTILPVDENDQLPSSGAALREHRDVAFDPATGLKLDIVRPGSERPIPLVVFVPGGGFVLADRGGNPARRRLLAEAGFAVASIEYRTSTPVATYVDGVRDVQAAVRFLRANAADYGLDTRRVAVWGESAGGYLAAMTGVTNGLGRFDPGEDPDPGGDVQAVVDMFGGSDLALLAADFDEPTQAFFGGPHNSLVSYVFGRHSGKACADDPAEAAGANPLGYVHAEAPPFLLFHGTDDRLVSPSQTLLPHNALLAAGASSTRYLLAGARHGDLAFLGDPGRGPPVGHPRGHGPLDRLPARPPDSLSFR
ncbi:alpha/beta hydrolase [Amycolatopsis sp. NPDC051371]|uniref:alpha/beta hydrolase n=1 Tax=Amycolatopsis sp. NPDC051371 TaxID=3155800 RepID=UPI003445BE19